MMHAVSKTLSSRPSGRFLKRPEEIARMQKAGQIVAGSLDVVRDILQAGIQTREIDRIVEEYVIKEGGKPAFKGYRGYPASTCISVNEEVVHGIPGERVIQDGDVVGVDIGVVTDGYYGDSAYTFAVGEVSEEARRVLEVGEESLKKALSFLRHGVTLRALASCIQNFVESHGYSVVRNYVGHGIGSSMHEEPQVPNFVDARFRGDMVLSEGMTLAIEPMVNVGAHDVETLENGWTVVTKDRRLSVHFEHTVVIGREGCDILTARR